MIDRDTTTTWMRLFRESVAEHREQLVELDTAIGDGDHGTNLDRGMGKAMDKLDADAPADAGAVLKSVAMTLVSTVGGAAGPLYGTLLLQMGTALAGEETIELPAFAAALRRGAEGVQARGKAQAGDKTMLDALLPAVVALEAGEDLDGALADAEAAARAGMEATVPLVARKGRASYLGERSAGHQDPGATSTYYLVQAARAALGS
jgi:phosphoenolpyruvate---glycerone phosphotransferase subunit DhaL